MDGVAGMMTVVSAVAAGNDVEAPVTLLRLEVGEKFLKSLIDQVLLLPALNPIRS